jgi:hypothetical protein
MMGSRWWSRLELGLGLQRWDERLGLRHVAGRGWESIPIPWHRTGSFETVMVRIQQHRPPKHDRLQHGITYPETSSFPGQPASFTSVSQQFSFFCTFFSFLLPHVFYTFFAETFQPFLYIKISPLLDGMALNEVVGFCFAVEAWLTGMSIAQS